MSFCRNAQKAQIKMLTKHLIRFSGGNAQKTLDVLEMGAFSSALMTDF